MRTAGVAIRFAGGLKKYDSVCSRERERLFAAAYHNTGGIDGLDGKFIAMRAAGRAGAVIAVFQGSGRNYARPVVGHVAPAVVPGGHFPIFKFDPQGLGRRGYVRYTDFWRTVGTSIRRLPDKIHGEVDHIGAHLGCGASGR